MLSYKNLGNNDLNNYNNNGFIQRSKWGGKLYRKAVFNEGTHVVYTYRVVTETF